MADDAVQIPTTEATPAALRTLSEDDALATLDASEKTPFVPQDVLDDIEPEPRGSVKEPGIGQLHPRALTGEEAPEKETRDTDPERASRLTAANTLLGKMKVPPGILESMDEDKRLEWAERLQPVYEQNSTVYRELAELKLSAKTPTAPVAESTIPAPTTQQASVPAPAEPTEHPSPVDLDAMESGFAEEFGEDAAKAFRKPFETMTQHTAAAFAEIGEMKGLLRDQMVTGARRELTGEFPQLSDPEVFARVKETADLLLGTGRFARYDDAVRKAAQVELAEEIADAKAQERFTQSDARDNGQMSVPERVSPASRAPLSGEQQEDFVIALLEKGYTPEQARVELARRNGIH